MKNSYRPGSKTLSIVCGAGIVALSLNTHAKPLAASTTASSKPLSFLENKGQVTDQYHNARPDIQFSVSAANGLTIFVGDGSIHYQFGKTDAGRENSFTLYRMDVELVGANKHAAVIADQKQNYYENYYTTTTGAQGARANTFNRITYKDVYPNIDWVLYCKDGHLKHEFAVRPGGKVSDIKLKYDGAVSLHINQDGSLTAETPQGDITELAPYTYQKDGKQISSSFKLNGGELSYETGSYTDDLIIDPTLEWGSYYGGFGLEAGRGVATDLGAANVYLSGSTSSPTSIATTGAHQVSFSGNFDAFLVKMNSAGVRQWGTYLGGSGDDRATGVCVTNVGIAISGYSNGGDGIASAWAPQYFNAGGTDGFIAQFDINGARQWSTFFGTSGDDTATDVANDATGNLYMCGRTNSTTGMGSAGSYQPNSGGGDDAFLIKYNSSGGSLWATYFGGSGDDMASSVHVDGFDNVYMGGQTGSLGGIATSGAHQTSLSGTTDAFAAKFASDGVIQWATYFGGTGDETGTITTDNAGNVALAGKTTTDTMLATDSAWKMRAFGTDAYVTRFSKDGVRQWSTYFGGNDSADAALAVTSDAQGNVYIGGVTYSTTDIAPLGVIQDAYFGFGDGFIAMLNSAGKMQYRTYYGGSFPDAIRSMVADPYGNLYVGGETRSTNRISTVGGHQPVLAGVADAFVSKFKGLGTLDVTNVQNNETMSVYPNPTTGAFAVEATSVGTLVLYSVDGKVILNEHIAKGRTNVTLPEATAAGVYFGKFVGENGSETTVRVVKE